MPSGPSSEHRKCTSFAVARHFIKRLQEWRLHRQLRAIAPREEDWHAAQAFTRWTEWDVIPQTRAAVEDVRGTLPSDELVVGHIDNDGRLLGRFGPLPCMDAVDVGHFVARRRFDLDVVLRDDHVLVRKNYHGDRLTFLREWLALCALSGRANVPALHHVDEARCLLYRNLVSGRTIREILVSRSVRILSVQTENDPEVACLSPRQQIKAVWARGRAAMNDSLPTRFLLELQNQVRNIHGAGVVGVSHTYGNVVMGQNDGEPWFIDLDRARWFPTRLSPRYLWKRDRERRQLVELYGQALT